MCTNNVSEKKTSKTRSVSMRIPAELYETIVALANQETRSVTSQVVYLLKKALESTATDTKSGS